MEKIFVIAALALAAACSIPAWAAQAPAAKQDLSDQDRKFIAACRQGYQKSYPDCEECQEIGWGKCDVYASVEEPLMLGDYSPENGKLYLKRKPCREAAQSAGGRQIKEKISAAWYAWRDDRGIFNLVINAQLKPHEQAVIWQVKDDCQCGRDFGCGWQALVVEQIRPTDDAVWLADSEPRCTWLRLGHITDDAPAEMLIKIMELKSLKVIKITSSDQP